MSKIIKAYKIIGGQSGNLLGFSALVQGSRAEPYRVDLFRMELTNSHEDYTVLISWCDCEDWFFRRRKEKTFCKHQRLLLDSAEQITEIFKAEPIFIEDADRDPNFDWRNF